jgi:DNA-binding NarL/FixJ family response regulator
VSPEPVRVLVLYSHPLMGEGLGRMLAAEPDMIVDAVDGADAQAVDAALARTPAIVVVEEGGALDAAEIVRRSQCPVVLDVDITTTSAWTLRREVISSRPDEFLAAIRNLAAGRAGADRADGAAGGTTAGDDRAPDPDRRPDPDRLLRTVIVPG